MLENVDRETSILSTPIPADFLEANPAKIIDVLNETLIKGDIPSKSILDKKSTGYYDGFYKLYHDIKVACSINIRTLKVGSDKYTKIDFFYKLASELLIRESSLLKVTLLSFKKEPSMASELDEQITNDFEKISYSYGTSNGEVITQISEMPDPNASNVGTSYLYGNSNSEPSTVKQPLFTSSTGKSELDPRLTIVPDPYSLAKTIPLPKNSGSGGATFESLNTQVSKIPLPTNNATTMLDNFVHVTWYIIAAPEWLTYKGKLLKPPVSSHLFKSQNGDAFKLVSTSNELVRSFAPLVDSKGTGVSSALKANIWLNQVGLKKLGQIRKEYLKNTGKEKKDESEETKKEEKKDEDSKPSEGVSEESTDSNKQLDEYDETKTIDVEKLLRWDPTESEELEELKKEKDTITQTSKLQKLITKEILALNKMRQDRYLRSSPSHIVEPSLTERKLYKKITKLITLTINLHNVAPSDLPVEFSKRIPVLMTEYSGTLPGLPASKNKPVKITNSRGSYRKKR